jgi:ribokinase
LAEGPARSKVRAASAGAPPRQPRFDVVGLGALNLDHLYAVPQLIQDGGVEVLTSSAQPGGSAANTIYALAKLGLRCGFVGVVGDDDAGKVLLDSFKEVGVETSGIRVQPGTATGQTICITAGQGQKAIYIVPGANNLLNADEVDPSYLGDARYVHISSFVGQDAFSQQSQIVEKLPSHAKLSFALDTLYARRGLGATQRLLSRCALLFANAEELQELTGEDPPAAARTCLEFGCEAVVVTFGAGRSQKRGHKVTASLIVTRRKTGRGPEFIEHTVPAPATHDGPIADTTGAGDAFAGGFLYGLLQETYSLPMCGALGHTAAGFSLGALGARAGLPTRQELLARFDEAFGTFSRRRRKSGGLLDPLHAG